MKKAQPEPARFAAWLLKHLLPEHIGPEGLGDYTEIFGLKVLEHGRIWANLWFCWQICLSLPPYLLEKFTWSFVMFKNYFKIAARHLVRQKGYSFINISGLAVGMACCILIALWVQDELSFDKFHKNADRIFRITYAEEIGGAHDHYAMSPAIGAKVLTEELPEVEAFTRLMIGSGMIRYGDSKYDETGIYFADPGFFEIFTHEFIEGDSAGALAEPGSIVLTEDTARKIFGRERPLGKILKLNTRDLKVTAVIRNPPPQSHLTFQYLVSLSTIRKQIANYLDNWLVIGGWSYVLMSENARPEAVEDKMAGIVERHAGEEARANGLKIFFLLQRVTDIHLRSHLEAEPQAQGDIRYVYIFSFIAVVILVIACINFMNLSTARSTKRAREVGMRKVFGAQRRRLIVQFMTESIAFSLLGLLGSVVLACLLLPEFNRLTGKALAIGQAFESGAILLIPGLILSSGLIAGFYPALVLSAFPPAEVLRSRLSRGARRSVLRNGLVTLQFAISVGLIICTLVVLQQVRFMKNQELGFDKEQVLVLRVRSAGIQDQFEAFRQRLKQLPEILETSFSDGVPGRVSHVLTVFKQSRPQTDSHTFDVILADYDFLKTYNIELASGRDFSRLFISDENGAFLVNETGAGRLGWRDETLGKKIGFSMDTLAPIVGVVKDFHYRSLREPFSPLAICLSPGAGQLLSIKLNTRKLDETLASIQGIWEEFEKDRSFLYFFVDENFDALYRSEDRFARIISLFSGLAIFVACLGLFGLASYTAEQSTKEIGIRRVLGASTPGLVLRFLREFLKWVLAANLIAWPLAYFTMNRYWLSRFSFRVDFNIALFLIAGLVSSVIALLTVSFQSIKAALSNPADTLRIE
jgi:putative ABC transport system permease protein